MIRTNPTTLAAALGVNPGDMVTLVGAGGKTTLMYRLLAELKIAGTKAAGATTTKILPPEENDRAYLVTAQDVDGLKTLIDHKKPFSPVIGKKVREDGKVEGIPPEWCDRLHASGAADTLVVEADGSKRKPLKAPGENEPVVPAGTTVFVAVLGLTCLDKTLDEENVFRADLVAAATGTKTGARIRPPLIAKLFLSPQGPIKGCPPGALKTVVLNQADDDELFDEARQIAVDLLEEGSPWDRVVIAHLDRIKAVEEIWSR